MSFIHHEVHEQASKILANKMKEVWQSEASMAALFKEDFDTMKFDRTKHASLLLSSVLKRTWREIAHPGFSPTGFDHGMSAWGVIKNGLLDYNLGSQLALNLLNHNRLLIMDTYQFSKDYKEAVDRLKENGGPDISEGVKRGFKLEPTDPNYARFKKAAALSRHKTVFMENSLPSYRVTPIGSTPAFADNQNLSMVSSSMDHYISVGGLTDYKIYYMVWDENHVFDYTKEAGTVDERGIEFTTPDLEYSIFSKSGDKSTVDRTLLIRKKMMEVFTAIYDPADVSTVIPRFGSLMIVTNKRNAHKFTTMVEPGVTIHEDSRPIGPVDAQD